MIPGSLMMMSAAAPAAPSYRYLRFHQTANVGGSDFASLYELDYSADAGSTWVPVSAMTTNTAPSPLVASADEQNLPAYLSFDSSTAQGWTAGSGGPHPHWLQIDFGAGNEIAPNQVRFVNENNGADMTPKDFTIQGSNTGAFAGEQATLLTVTGAVTQPHKTLIIYTI